MSAWVQVSVLVLVPASVPVSVPALVPALASAPVVLQEWGPQLLPKPLLKRPPKHSTGLQLGFLLASLDLESVLAFLALELVLAFLALELVLAFLALGQVQYLEPWLQQKQPNMEQEGSGLLVEQVSQVVWQEPDLRPQLLLPKLLPKLPNLASGEPEPWEPGGSEPGEPSQGLGASEVCPQLQLLKQPNMELQQDLASDCLLFTQVVEPGAWELVVNLPSPMEGPWEPWDTKVGPAWGNPVAGRESELPRTPDSRPHQRWCYCLVENVNPL